MESNKELMNFENVGSKSWILSPTAQNDARVRHCELKERSNPADENKEILRLEPTIPAKNENPAQNDVNKAAFTLAEVLITLGIIGVVAAMTLPGLIANHQKKVAAKRLEQTYSQLLQAINMAQSEYGDMKNWDVVQDVSVDLGDPNQRKDLTVTFVEQYIAPHLKLSKNSQYKAPIDMGYSNYLNKDGSLYLTNREQRYISELANGVTLIWTYNFNGTTKYTTPIVFVDINGKSKPNMLGRDFFLFYVYYGKPMMLEPSGYGYSRSFLIDSCKKGASGNQNLHCAALIQMDGWEIKDDYPW